MKKIKKLLMFTLALAAIVVCFAFSSSAVVYTSNMAGNCEPYSSYNCSLEKEISMGGNTYKDALVFKSGYNSGWNADAKFNFNGKYESMSFDVGHYSGAQVGISLLIKIDGVESQKIALSSSALPKKVTISLKGVHQVILRFCDYSGYDTTRYAVGNVQLSSKTKVEPTVLKSDNIGNCEPYSMINCEYSKETTFGGNTYKDALIFKSGYNPGWNADAKFNFNGKYESMSFEVGHHSNSQVGISLLIKVDGEEKQKISLSSDDLPKKVTIPLKGVHQVILRFCDYSGYDTTRYAIGNIKLSSKTKVEPVILKSNVINNCEPYSSTNCSYVAEMKMGGNTYKDAYTLRTGYNPGWTADAKFNFNGNYESMTFYAGHYDGKQSQCNLTIKVDGEEVSKTTISSEDLPKKFTVSLKGVHQVILCFDGYTGYDSMYYGVGGINLVSNGKVQGIKMLTENLELSATNPSSYAKAQIIPADAKNNTIKWSSSNSNIANVDSKGLVTAVSGGTVTITAKTAEGGYIGTCNVNVDLPVMPGAVSSIKGEMESTSVVLLNWNNTATVTGYAVYQKTSSGWKLLAHTTSTTYRAKSLTPGKKYTFAVRPYVEKDGFKVYASKYKSADVVVLGTTSKITTTKKFTTVSLKWNKVTGAAGYRVFQKVDGKWKTLIDTTKLTYTVKKLKQGAKYSFAVKAYFLDGKTKVFAPKYKSASATTLKLGTTSKLTATQTTSSVSIKWNKVAGATGYRVFRMKKGKWVKLADTTKLTYTDKKLNSGSTYKYAVKAYGKQGETVIWATKYKQVETSTKPATSTLKVTSTAKGKAVLNWSNPSGESGFEIYYSTKKDSGFKKIATTKANVKKATISKLQSKKTYYFKVRSFKTTQSGKAYSAYSAVKRVKVK